MKPVILALVGTLIGGGVGTGGGAFLLAQCESDAADAHASDDAVHDSTAVDSTAVIEAEGPDTVGALGPLPDHAADSVAAPGDEAEPAPTPEDVAPPADVEAAAEPDTPPPGSIDPVDPAVEPIVLAPTPDPTALRRLARIFSNMKAEQAAAVMVELTDAEAQRILVSMSERAAAAILGKMDSSRAAVLSQLVLGGGGEE